ncbi:hypothetical protein AVEN_273233-1 [Araneus ventricosus]|uniref:Uncharacterized protein n=1 Tax=Araneus ventricosus TaxID=182803 RepID=A0A4Y2IV93_ARAVE|nr:hypothetical protein AVEN_273233-1 [Araneus ventricosus]
MLRVPSSDPPDLQHNNLYAATFQPSAVPVKESSSPVQYDVVPNKNSQAMSGRRRAIRCSVCSAATLLIYNLLIKTLQHSSHRQFRNELLAAVGLAASISSKQDTSVDLFSPKSLPRKLHTPIYRTCSLDAPWLLSQTEDAFIMSP